MKLFRYLMVIFFSAATGMGVQFFTLSVLGFPPGLAMFVGTAEAGLVGYLIALIYVKYLIEEKTEEEVDE